MFYLHHRDGIVSPGTFADTLDRIMAGERVGRWPTMRDLGDRVPGIGCEP